MTKRDDTPSRTDGSNPALIGLAAWVLPGLGHWLLGHRARGLVLFVAIMLTYWTGIAVAGPRFTVDPKDNTLWFAAQMGMGPQVVVLYVATAGSDVPPVPWPDSDIALIYAGVAGLLAMLVILDAIGRAAGDEPVATEEQRGAP